MLRQICVVAAAVLAALFGPSEPMFGGAGPPATKKVVLIATKADHPYGTHMYSFECGLLAKCLRQNGVDAFVSLDWPTGPKAFEGVSSIVFYSRPAGDIVLSEPIREPFQRLMSEGVGLVAIHWATGIGYSDLADRDDIRTSFKNTLGGWFRRPPCGIQFATTPLVQLDPGHAICRGWESNPHHDEFYLDLVFHEDVKPVLEATVDGKKQVVAWAFDRPASAQGRSFGTTLGHFHECFARESFRRAIVNGILWTAHVEVPASGARVTVDNADLQLPPNPTPERAAN